MKTYARPITCAAFILGLALLGCDDSARTKRPTDTAKTTAKRPGQPEKADGDKTKTTEKGKEPDEPEPAGHLMGSEDTLGKGGKQYTITCIDIGEKPKRRPVCLGGTDIIRAKTGIPFLIMNGRYRDVVTAALKVKNQPVGWGFRGVIVEDADGKPLLDIAFEDAEAITDVQDGTEIKSRSMRWLKRDFCRKPLEFMMRNDKGELLWGIRMTITERKPAD